MSDKRAKTKNLRMQVFKNEQSVIADRIQKLRTAIDRNNLSDARHWVKLIGISIEYLEANNPKHEYVREKRRG